jgi:hypothetical protein
MVWPVPRCPRGRAKERDAPIEDNRRAGEGRPAGWLSMHHLAPPESTLRVQRGGSLFPLFGAAASAHYNPAVLDARPTLVRRGGGRRYEWGRPPRDGYSWRSSSASRS